MQDSKFQQPIPEHKPPKNGPLVVSIIASCISFLSIIFFGAFFGKTYSSYPNFNSSEAFLGQFTTLALVFWFLTDLVAIVYAHVALGMSRKDTELSSSRDLSIVALLCSYALVLIGIGVLCATLSQYCSTVGSGCG